MKEIWLKLLAIEINSGLPGALELCMIIQGNMFLWELRKLENPLESKELGNKEFNFGPGRALPTHLGTDG